jgi:hypothetical protein
MDVKKTYWAIALAIATLWAVFLALLGIVIGLSPLGASRTTTSPVYYRCNNYRVKH